MWYDEHTVEPDTQSILEQIAIPIEDRILIGMKRGNCAHCGRPIDFDDDNAWHVEYDQ